jgi:hypothetical protein
VPHLFLFAAIPMVVGLICSVGIARFCQTRLGGMHLDDVSTTLMISTPSLDE